MTKTVNDLEVVYITHPTTKIECVALPVTARTIKGSYMMVEGQLYLLVTAEEYEASFKEDA